MATKPAKPTKATKRVSTKADAKSVDSFKHDADKRLLIPSKEEAGDEAASDVVKAKAEARYPLNPVTHRGQDPELFWLGKYGNDDAESELKIDIRSLYRHEHIDPETIISKLYTLKRDNDSQSEMFEVFGNYKSLDEWDKPKHYYKSVDNWKNRLIQGDSLLVMTSLLEREGMAGKVQCIYMDPPYGISYKSNWQLKLNDRNVKESADEHLSGEPEVIKAFRDTWELGIHSYLTYLRDRLLVARELLSASGSCFVQISAENVHLVRSLCDEVFGSQNFVAQITFRKKLMPLGAKTLESMADFLVWYARDGERVKYRQLYMASEPNPSGRWTGLELPDGTRRPLSGEERKDFTRIPGDARIFGTVSQIAPSYSSENVFPIEVDGRTYLPPKGACWVTTKEKMEKLRDSRRLQVEGDIPRYVLFHDDFPYQKLTNPWSDTAPAVNAGYVVQTSNRVLERCILMTTDPGDLVLDPTCGSGTTAFVAEQWGRRWITSDTSRIALNIAKTRLMTATYDWYKLTDSQGGDVRHGFDYKEILHVTLKSVVNDEPPTFEKLFDQPLVDKSKLRVAGPFTVETLQSYDVLSPDELADQSTSADALQHFTQRIYEHLKTAGVKNGARNENAVFARINPLAHEALHAEGWYAAKTADGRDVERKAYIHLGPQFGAVVKQQVNEAMKEARSRGDADWLIILGFAFDSDIDTEGMTQRANFQVSKVRMNDDLLQSGLTKKDKKAASFVTIGEPDIAVHRAAGTVEVEIQGLDIYDPITDQLKPRSVADINYWMVDDDYDGANFTVRQVYFCGGDKDEFAKWKRGLSDLAKQSAKKKAEKTLKIEIDDEAFDRLYGFKSQPISVKKGGKIAVRVISQYGEESTKVISL